MMMMLLFFFSLSLSLSPSMIEDERRWKKMMLQVATITTLIITKPYQKDMGE
jgi:Na+/glutamate symporter